MPAPTYVILPPEPGSDGPWRIRVTATGTERTFPTHEDAERWRRAHARARLKRSIGAAILEPRADEEATR